MCNNCISNELSKLLPVIPAQVRIAVTVRETLPQAFFKNSVRAITRLW